MCAPVPNRGARADVRKRMAEQSDGCTELTCPQHGEANRALLHQIHDAHNGGSRG